MDDFPSLSGPRTHQVDIFTDLFLISGLVTGPFKRVSDLLNRAETDHVTIQQAIIAPFGQQTPQKSLDTPVLVGRSSILLASDRDVPTPKSDPAQRRTGDLYATESLVRKVSHPCCALAGPFIVYANCHLLEDATLENLLRGSDGFIALTEASIYLTNRPGTAWQRPVVILNRRALTAIYLVPGAAAQQPG